MERKPKRRCDYDYVNNNKTNVTECCNMKEKSKLVCGGSSCGFSDNLPSAASRQALDTPISTSPSKQTIIVLNSAIQHACCADLKTRFLLAQIFHENPIV
jgi:hypothetical protein